MSLDVLPAGCMGTYLDTDLYRDEKVRICRRDGRECTWEGKYLNDCPRAHDTDPDRLSEWKREGARL